MRAVYLEKTTNELSYFIFHIDGGKNDKNKVLEFEKIDSIAAKAFLNASEIKKVSFDENLQKIGMEAFKNCKDLEVFSCGKESIFGDEDGNYILTREADGSKAEKTNKTPKAQEQNTKAGGNKTCESDNKKNIKASFVIESLAFSNCKNLHTIILPDCDKLVIEKDAFANCSSLRTLVCCKCKVDFTGNPFEDCPETLTFICEKDSELERFARENGFRSVNV